MSQTTRTELLEKLRRRYLTAGMPHKKKLLDQAQELLGYHRKAAIRAMRITPAKELSVSVIAGRPRVYEPELLRKWLRPIWEATDYACSLRLKAMLAEWIPAFEQHERALPVEARDKLLSASARTLDRLLQPLRAQRKTRSLTRPGTLLRQQIPIRGTVWEEGKPGWLEVDTVALCGGNASGEYVWMLDGVDYATAWVEVRAMWGRGQHATLAALKDVEARLPFALLGMDSDNGGEFLNYHVMHWLQRRPKPVFMTRSRPYKKDDNAHVEQKNWTHVRQQFGYERHDNPEVVAAMNQLLTGTFRKLFNFFHASMKLDPGTSGSRRLHGDVQTPLARVLASEEVTEQTKQQLLEEKAAVNPFALKLELAQELKKIDGMRRISAH